jgi:hypothetical protein
MTAPTDAELAAWEADARIPYGRSVHHLVAEDYRQRVPVLIAALREARARISDLDDELVEARQPASDLEGALEIVKVANAELRTHLAEARAHALTPDEARVLKVEMHDGYLDDDPTWDEDRDRAPFESAMAKLDAAMAPAPDARSVMDALGGEIVPTGEQQDAINRAFASESRAISTKPDASERAP